LPSLLAVAPRRSSVAPPPSGLRPFHAAAATYAGFPPPATSLLRAQVACVYLLCSFLVLLQLLLPCVFPRGPVEVERDPSASAVFVHLHNQCA
jgi:hypothetical protein